jgi:hypothetical protein
LIGLEDLPFCELGNGKPQISVRQNPGQNRNFGPGSFGPIQKSTVPQEVWRATADEDGHYCIGVAL